MAFVGKVALAKCTGRWVYMLYHVRLVQSPNHPPERTCWCAHSVSHTPARLRGYPQAQTWPSAEELLGRDFGPVYNAQALVNEQFEEKLEDSPFYKLDVEELMESIKDDGGCLAHSV